LVGTGSVGYMVGYANSGADWVGSIVGSSLGSLFVGYIVGCGAVGNSVGAVPFVGN